MGEDSVGVEERYTSEAGLCALGLYLRSIGFWGPIEDGVHVPQKTVRYQPQEKLRTLVSLFLCGGRHVVEANKKVRADPALCHALGCAPCDQSVLSDTLSACTRQTVEQYHLALAGIFRRFSQACRHNFHERTLVLDLDLTGLVCGKKAEGATKGYFAHKKNATGRQAGRVLASQYDEVVVDKVYAGTEQLAQAVPALVETAEMVLGLEPYRRRRTLIRTDGGGGTKEDIQWLNDRGYHVLTKVYAWHTATALRNRVERWLEDPRTKGRQVGRICPSAPDWGKKPFVGFPRNVTFVGLKFIKDDGTEGGAVLATTLGASEVVALVGWPQEDAWDPDKVALAITLLYDRRGGGVETAFKEDKQALSLSRCNKRSLAAQGMITASIALAHNITIWAKSWLIQEDNVISGFGILRMIRDVLAIRGRVGITPDTPITFAQTEPDANKILCAFQGLFAPNQHTLRLGQI